MQTSSVSPVIRQLNWDSLEMRRKQAIVVVMYWIVYRLAAIPTVVLVPTMSIRRNMYLVPYARSVIYQRSFFPDTNVFGTLSIQQ